MCSKTDAMITKTFVTFSSLQNSFQIVNLWNPFFLIEMQVKVAFVTLSLNFNENLPRLQWWMIFPNFLLWKVLFGHDFQNKSCQIKLHMLPLWAERVCFELYSYRLAHLWVKLLKKGKHTLGNVICSTWQSWFSLYHLYHRALLTIWVFAWDCD